MSISACLIVRDEADNLARCLTSIKDAVDQIVVVDTGSMDQTVAIAESFGAQIVHYKWQDDFAAARNESLRHAKGDWILQIDADEELVEHHPGALRRSICRPERGEGSVARRHGARTSPPAQNDGPTGLLIAVRSPADERGSAETVGQQCRLFRNHQGLHFTGRIHEQLRGRDGQTLANVAPAPEGLSLHHRGYIDAGDALRRKGERNRRLLELSIAEEPQQPAHHFNLGRQLVWEGRFSESLMPLLRAIYLWNAQGAPEDGYVPSMFSTTALAANKLQLWDEVLALHDAAAEHAVSSELVYVAGIAAWRLGNLERAEQLLNRAWQDSSLARGTGLDPSTSGWRPLTALAELYESQGRIEDARAMRERSAELSPAVLSEAQNGTRSPNISACLIVRDEEANLPRCISSLQGAVDEIIVVDTGSTDQTAQLAEKLGAKVFHFEWCDDFAAARNESLRQASAEWILWIDADDELVQRHPGALRELTQTQNPLPLESYYLEVHSLTAETGEVGAVTKQCRLFRNGLDIRFAGRIHEQLVLGGAPADQHDVVVRHWGYIPAGDAMDRKCERNRRLLQLEMNERPDDPFPYYMLGKQYVWQRDYASALDMLEQAFNRWQLGGHSQATYVAPLFAVATCAALNLGQLERALAFEASCPAEALSSDLLYYAAIACQRLGRLEDALSRLQRAVGDPNVRNALETDPATSGWRSWYLASQVCNALGRSAEAYAAAARAIETMPASPDVLLSFAGMAAAKGHVEDARRAAERVLAGAPGAEHAARARALLTTLEPAELMAV